MTDTTSYTGHREITSPGSDHNAESLNVTRALDERRTNTVVKVLKVYPGQNGNAPTADVQVMVDQVDGLDTRQAHGTVYGVAVGRNHSGSGAIVSDPVPGDLYHMAVADRDISSFKANGGQQSGPGSRRKGSLSDGILTHAVVTPAPTQAVVFKPGGGVKIFDKGGAVIETSADGKTVYVTPAGGGMLYLGGNPASGGTFSAVETVAGPSSVVQAKL